MKTKRIIVLSLGRRGAGPVIGWELAKAISGEHKVLLIHSKQSELNVQYDAPDMHCISMNTFNGIISLIFSFIFPVNIINVVRQIMAFKADIVIWPMIHPWTPFINILIGKTSIITLIHDPRAHMGTNDIVWSLYTKGAMNSSSMNVFLSSQSFASIENTSLRTKSMYITLPVFEYYGKHIEDRQDESLNLLFFGRIQKYKDIGLLLDIFEGVQKQCNNVRLIIAGEGNISQWTDRIEHNNSIKLINRWIENEEIKVLFSQSHIVLLPYREATQSGIIPLAYEFNIPVIASAQSGIKSQIIDKKTGMLIKNNNTDEFISACVNILKNRQLYKSMTEHINEYRRTHTWDNAIYSILKGFEDE